LLKFSISASTLPRLCLPYIFDRGDSYGKLLADDGAQNQQSAASTKNVLVEFSSPNLTKEFDSGHLRSSLLGQSIASLYSAALRYNVSTTNFIGDWGQHMGLLAVGWKRFGSDEQLEAEPLRHVLQIFAEIEASRVTEQDNHECQPIQNGDVSNSLPSVSAERDDFFHRLETGEEEALSLWHLLRDTCILAYKNAYAALNIHFDDYCGESGVSSESIG
jgi:arginyl-tRNA synthetase